MTGKEALEGFIPVIEFLKTLPVSNEDDKAELVKGLYENVAIIGKDLDVLDMLKPIVKACFALKGNGINAGYLCACIEANDKIKEWLRK